MRNASLPLAALSVLAILGIGACIPPRATGRDAGAETADGGSALVFSLGVADTNSPVHQVAPTITLQFETGTLGPGVVLSRRVATPPKLDGLDSDWASIAGSIIPLHSDAAAIGMTVDEWNSGFGLLDGGLRPYDLGIDSALVKSAYDDQNIYFLVQWADATNSVNKNTLTFADGGWVRNTDEEDRLFLSFDVNFPDFRELGCAAACHLRERLDDTSDAGRAYRERMHTNGPGERADVWSWGSVMSNPSGYADDTSWDQAGRAADDSRGGFTTTNRGDAGAGAVAPLFMSEQGVNANPAAIFAPDSGLHPAAIPFDPSGVIPGSHIPGSVNQIAQGSRADVRAVGLWRNGKWTVELARARVTPDPNDAQFPIP